MKLSISDERGVVVFVSLLPRARLARNGAAPDGGLPFVCATAAPVWRLASTCSLAIDTQPADCIVIGAREGVQRTESQSQLRWRCDTMWLVGPLSEWRGVDRGAAASLGVTRRESEVLDAVVERLSNAEIAAKLFVSERTVESHVSALLRNWAPRTVSTWSTERSCWPPHR